jgi:hypothetical protein
VQVGKKFKAKIGKELNKDSSKEEFFEKLKEIFNFFVVGSVDEIFQEDLPTFPQYETEILNEHHPVVSVLYAIFFIKGRWHEAEKNIQNDNIAFNLYAQTLKERAIELEPKIIKSPEMTLAYCKNVFKRKRIPEEIHNAMICHAFSDVNNKFVKKYFKLKKNKIK